jgi:hypothetical protein
MSRHTITALIATILGEAAAFLLGTGSHYRTASAVIAVGTAALAITYIAAVTVLTRNRPRHAARAVTGKASPLAVTAGEPVHLPVTADARPVQVPPQPSPTFPPRPRHAVVRTGG